MINKSLDQINLDDLRQLQANAVAESKTIEYKQKLPTNLESARKEFLADISSFANASGGDLIFGITEKGGVPKSIDGVEVENVDEAIGKYENIVRDGIEPRIAVSTKTIMVSSNKHVFIFRVQSSWLRPHRVVYRRDDKFYSRHSTGKYALNTAELKIAFTLSQTLTEQIKKFKTERIAQVYENDLPLQLYKGAKIVLHLIPLEAFSPNCRIDLKSIINAPRKLRPVYAQGWDFRINLEGVLSYFIVRDNMSYSYVQLYRNGIFEAVESSILNVELVTAEHKKVIPSRCYEHELLRSLQEYLSLANELGVSMPIAIFLTLIGVKGWRMSSDWNIFSGIHMPTLIDREILQLPETLVEEYDTKPQDILRPIFDFIWNACGYERSANFDEAGNWVTRT